MKYSISLLIVFTWALSGCAQNGTAQADKAGLKSVGGSCEGCEAIHESPVPFEQLTWIDTLPDYHEAGPKMEISGVIYQRDGKTPAEGIVLYIYHTDQKGIYPTKGNESGWGKRHGYLRGWIRTNEKGQYKFYTLRPASYPNSNNPQHIHPTIKEPGYTEYYIDEYVFTDDPYLTKDQLKHHQGRGGSGVVTPTPANGILLVKRDIILGLNIPGYPKASVDKPAGQKPYLNDYAFVPMLFISNRNEKNDICL